MKHKYTNLRIWQDARNLNVFVYHLTEVFPKEEKYSLTNQLRRASVSIVSNIAEGSAGQSNKMFAKYLHYSLGSLCEVETQFYLAFDINYITETELKELIERTNLLRIKMIAFLRKIK